MGKQEEKNKTHGSFERFSMSRSISVKRFRKNVSWFDQCDIYVMENNHVGVGRQATEPR